MAVGSGGGSGGRAGAIKAGEAFVQLGTRDSGLTKGLERAKAAVLAFGAAGVAGIALVAASFSDVLKHFDELNKAADRTGATTEALSALEYAAKQSDATLEDVANGAKFLQRTLSEAAGGSKEAQQALDKLGLTADELKGKSLDEQFAMLADGIEAIEDPADRTAAALAVLGRGGLALIPMLKDGSRGLRELTKEAEDVGAVVGGDQAKAATRIADSLDRAWTALVNTFRMVGAALLPLVDDIEAVANGLVLTLKLMRQMAPLLMDQVRGWNLLGGQFQETWNGIKDAIAGGDILLAFQIATDGVQLVWAKLVAGMTFAWNQFKNTVVDTFYDAMTEVKVAVAEAADFMRREFGVKMPEGPLGQAIAGALGGVVGGPLIQGAVGKSPEQIRAEDAAAQAARNLARALDQGAAMADVKAAQDKLNADIQKAAILKWSRLAGDIAVQAILGTVKQRRDAADAVIAASHGTFSTFGGGRQMFGGGGGVLESIKKNTGDTAQAVKDIDKKLPARFN